MSEYLDLQADVVVIGGGPAGAWAAIKASEAGAEVILVDKGFFGTSGATAPSGTGVWYVEPDAEKREIAKAGREKLGGYLARHSWMDRVLDQTYENVNRLATEVRYPFPIDPETGQELRGGLQGPEYLKRLRLCAIRHGIKILDHSPVLELLVDPRDGSVKGVHGVRRQANIDYRITANSVVLATGGCAFLAGALGTNVDTGDGALFAAEVGAHLSGMEFSNSYAMALKGATVTKTAYYSWASFYNEDGSPLEGAASKGGRSIIARRLSAGHQVLCKLDKADEKIQAQMRLGQANFFLQFDRSGINPFTDLFPVGLLAEGTIRGTGGINLVSDDCWTGIPGLYAAGDAATREFICGGFTGGGSHNAAWAMSSGSFAGIGAAKYALSNKVSSKINPADLIAAGQQGLRPSSHSGSLSNIEALKLAQDALVAYDRNYQRTASRMEQSLGELNELWTRLDKELVVPGDNFRTQIRTREIAAIVANGRWIYSSALDRKESRGMAKREDFPELDPNSYHHTLSGGLDEVWVKRTPALGGLSDTGKTLVDGSEIEKRFTVAAL